MSIAITALITAAVAGPLGYYFNVWWPRHRGRHSDKDSLRTLDVFIAEKDEERAKEEAAHREHMDRLNAPPVPDVTDVETQLLSGNDAKAVLCGGYGRVRIEPDWPTEVFARQGR
jgi:hypothetical protein